MADHTLQRIASVVHEAWQVFAHKCIKYETACNYHYRKTYNAAAALEQYKDTYNSDYYIQRSIVSRPAHQSVKVDYNVHPAGCSYKSQHHIIPGQCVFAHLL